MTFDGAVRAVAADTGGTVALHAPPAFFADLERPAPALAGRLPHPLIARLSHLVSYLLFRR